MYGRRPNVVFVRYWSQTEPPWDRRNVPWIVRLTVSWGMAMVGFLAAEALISGIEIDGWEALLPAAAIFVVARALLRPLLLLLTCPLQIITFGLFIFVINAAILALTAWLSDRWGIGFDVDGFVDAFLGALVISAASFLLSRLLARLLGRRPGATHLA
jgi:putative membrane protein